MGRPGRPAGARWRGRVAPGHERLQHVEIDRLVPVMVEPGLDRAAAILVVAGATEPPVRQSRFAMGLIPKSGDKEIAVS